MKKLAQGIVYVSVLLVVLTVTVERGYCYSFGGRVFIDGGDGIYTVDDGLLNGVIATISPEDDRGKATMTTGDAVDDGRWYFSIYGSNEHEISLSIPVDVPYTFAETQNYLDGKPWEGTISSDGKTLKMDVKGLEIFNYFDETWGNHGDEMHVAVEAAVPIPGAVWLLSSGLIGLVGIRRRFKKT